MPDDADYALAWQQVEAEECNGCGQPRSETYQPDSAWLVHRETCRACAAVAAAAKDDSDPGSKFSVVPNEIEISPSGW